MDHEIGICAILNVSMNKIKDRNIAYDADFVQMSNDKPPKAKMYRSAK